MREALAAGQRVFLGVSRLTAALACDECGHVPRCEACGIALGHSRSAASLVCRLCAATAPLPDSCPGCRGRRLSPFGWSAERVEQAVRRRFPKVRVARYDPDARRGSRGEAQRVAAAAAEIVIGTRGGLKLFGPATLGLAAFISPDQLMRQADFRAGERAFALMWAAAERLRPGGRLVIQSQNPTHYVLDSIRAQSLETFYRQELRFRSELGYPPFRRLAVVTARGRTAGDSERLAGAVASALRAAPALAVYPPPPARDRARRLVVKGHADLPRVLAAALGDFLVPTRGRRGIMGDMVDVEVDPIEWQS
jgi:primosomal protein N' (replication factor Y)